MPKFHWSPPSFSVLALLTTLIVSVYAVAQDEAVEQTAVESQNKSQMLELWKPGDTGQRMRIRGRVTDANGNPLPDVTIRFRHADSEGVNRSYFQGEVVTNRRGAYQFGSVIPGNNHRLSHVHVYISHPGFTYVDTEFHFKDDPKAAPDDPNAIFLEEGEANGEKMMFGQWDISLTPQ